jgi:site-specific DNA recombinase
LMSIGRCFVGALHGPSDKANDKVSVVNWNSGIPRRDHLRALAQRVEVDAKEVRIMGSKSVLLRTLVAASSVKTAGFGVPSFVPKWRARRDSNC